LKCPNCGATIAEGRTHCARCNQAIDAFASSSARKGPSRSARIAMGLMWAVFALVTIVFLCLAIYKLYFWFDAWRLSRVYEATGRMAPDVEEITLAGDELISAKITHGEEFIFVGSHNGQAIRFAESQVRPMGRQARGVRAMDLAKDDYLVGMEVVEKEGLILSIAENGFGKRTPLQDYRLTARGGKGVINMKTTNKTGKVVSILSVMEDSDLVIVSQNGKIIRIESSTIRQAGRSTQGVKLVSLEEGDKVAAASVVPDTENGNGNGDNGQETLIQ
jgi:hypothetical protein